MVGHVVHLYFLTIQSIQISLLAFNNAKELCEIILGVHLFLLSQLSRSSLNGGD